MTTTNDGELSSHRVRSNVWPAPHLHPPAALIAAVDDVFDDIVEDRS